MQQLLIGFLSLFLVFGGSSASKATAIILDPFPLPSDLFVGDTFDMDLAASGFGAPPPRLCPWRNMSNRVSTSLS